MIKSETLREQDIAKQVANRWLDGDMNPLVQMVPGDPDCDACVLARQYLRAVERIEQLQKMVEDSGGYRSTH